MSGGSFLFMTVIGFLLPGFQHNTDAVGNPVHEIEVRNDRHHIEYVLIRKAGSPQAIAVI